jgi:hypothetical protein
MESMAFIKIESFITSINVAMLLCVGFLFAFVGHLHISQAPIPSTRAPPRLGLRSADHAIIELHKLFSLIP